MKLEKEILSVSVYTSFVQLVPVGSKPLVHIKKMQETWELSPQLKFLGELRKLICCFSLSGRSDPFDLNDGEDIMYSK